MANPPFNPVETIPEDTGVVSIYPNQERAFRDIIESWLLYEHGRSGHHKFPVGAQIDRDNVTSWEVGSVFYDNVRRSFQIVNSIAPVVFHDIGFPLGTRMLFQQNSAPLGWTKEADTAYNDAAVVGTVGGVSTGGLTAFTTVMAARTIQVANLPNTTLSLAGIHTEQVVSDVAITTGGQQAASGTANNFVLPPVGATVTKINAAIGGTLPLGGSSQNMDFNVKKFYVIVATKD